MIPAMFALTVAVAISYPHILPMVVLADLVCVNLARPK